MSIVQYLLRNKQVALIGGETGCPYRGTNRYNGGQTGILGEEQVALTGEKQAARIGGQTGCPFGGTNRMFLLEGTGCLYWGSIV